MNERETHFQGYAKLLYDDLYDMFNNLFIEEADMGPSEQEAERTRQHIQSYISERTFDFADHIIKHTWGSTLDEMRHEGLAHFLEVSYPEYTDLPDMTEWPE